MPTREGPAVRPELVKKRCRGLAHDTMTVRCSCRTGCDRPTARRQPTIPMLLSFQRPDAKKARPPRLHDPTTLRKRRRRSLAAVRDGGHGSTNARPAPRRILAGARRPECGAGCAGSEAGYSAPGYAQARVRPTPAMAVTPPPPPPLPFQYAPPPAQRRKMRLRKTRLAIAVLAWLALGLVSLFYGFMTALAQDLPQFEVAQLAQQSNGVIYADDGKTVLGVLRSDQYRVLVHWKDIAPVMRNAVVSVEDRRFYSHGAIDPVGMARAAVVNIWTGTLAQGGSTITQQLVKNRWHPAQAEHALAAAQDHRGRARLPGRAALVEAEDPRGVPQHHLLRPPGLRRRGGGRGVLRRAREEPAAAPGRAARARSCRTRRPTTRSCTRRRPGSDAGSCSASCSSRATSTSSSTASPTAKPLLPRGRPIGFPAEKKTIANYFVDYVRQQLINLYGRQEGARRRAARLHDAQSRACSAWRSRPCARRCRSAGPRPRSSRSTRPPARSRR